MFPLKGVTLNQAHSLLLSTNFCCFYNLISHFMTIVLYSLFIFQTLDKLLN